MCWGFGCLGFWKVTGHWHLWPNQWINPFIGSISGNVIERCSLIGQSGPLEYGLGRCTLLSASSYLFVFLIVMRWAASGPK
jgi:hypothetical protein